MKKGFLVLFSLFFCLGSLFAQDLSGIVDNANKVDLSTKFITPKDQHTADRTATVKIEYMPMVNELRIYYTSMYVTYDVGEAMNSIQACLKDFIKEHQYYNYKYMERDRERYFKSERGYNMAQYVSHVQLLR